MMREEQFSILKNQNDMIIKLLAASVIEGKNLSEQVSLLTTVGLAPAEIAGILGKNRNLISVIKNKNFAGKKK